MTAPIYPLYKGKKPGNWWKVALLVVVITILLSAVCKGQVFYAGEYKPVWDTTKVKLLVSDTLKDALPYVVNGYVIFEKVDSNSFTFGDPVPPMIIYLDDRKRRFKGSIIVWAYK